MSVVSVENRGPVTILSINRPEKLNAINKAVAIELQEAFADFDRSAQRVAILCGAGGRAFSAGADITDLPELWRCVPTVGIATDKPIIAAVSGWCIGGGLVMAMMCDLLVAAENAKFSYPEGKVGITGGMIAGLAARIPHKIAMEMMLVGEPMTAERAYQVGLANRIVGNGTEIEEASTLARKIIDLAPLALATMKRFVNDHVLPKGPAEPGCAIRGRTRRGPQQRRCRRGHPRIQGAAQAALPGTLTRRQDSDNRAATPPACADNCAALPAAPLRAPRRSRAMRCGPPR